MSQNPQCPVWNQLLGESMQAMRQQRYSQAAMLLRTIVGGESRKALACQTKVLGLAPNDPESRGNFLLLLKVGGAHLPDSAEFRRVLHSVLGRSDVGEYALEIARSLLKDSV